MEMAGLMARRSSCPRAAIGAVAVDPDTQKVLGVAYNGAPRDMPQCDEVGCLIEADHCIRALHAEQNILIFVGPSLVGATLYLTHTPCRRCCNLLIQSAIDRVVYRDDHRPEDGAVRVLEHSGVRVDRWEGELGRAD